MGSAHYAPADVDRVLAHYGVKGMKWGTHRTPVKRQSDSHSIVTSKGEKATLEGMKTPLIARGIAAISPAFRKKLENSDSYAIKNSSGQRVGELNIKKDPEEKNALNVIWVETHDNHKGKGYATAAMHKAIDIARKQGRDKVTLEVPGSSPDARHIYEKLGFKSKGMYKDSTVNDIWGGLTRMELDLRKTKAQHSLEMDEFLVHYGVKGMKWGRHKTRSSDTPPTSSDAATASDHKSKVSAGGTKTLTTKELQELVTRMNLEQQYANLNKKSRPYKTGYEAVKEILGVVKTVQEIHGAVNSPLVKDIRNAIKKRRGG